MSTATGGVPQGMTLPPGVSAEDLDMLWVPETQLFEVLVGDRALYDFVLGLRYESEQARDEHRDWLEAQSWAPARARVQVGARTVGGDGLWLMASGRLALDAETNATQLVISLAHEAAERAVVVVVNVATQHVLRGELSLWSMFF